MIKKKSFYIVPHIYLNVGSDGSYGNSLLLCAELFKIKEDVPEELLETVCSDIVFDIRKDFNESLLYLFDGEKTKNIFSMTQLVKGQTFVSVKPFPLSIWDLEKKDQIEELKLIKESLFAELLGKTFFSCNVAELSIVLQNPYCKISEGKAFFKKISSDKIIKVS